MHFTLPILVSTLLMSPALGCGRPMLRTKPMSMSQRQSPQIWPWISAQGCLPMPLQHLPLPALQQKWMTPTWFRRRGRSGRLRRNQSCQTWKAHLHNRYGSLVSIDLPDFQFFKQGGTCLHLLGICIRLDSISQSTLLFCLMLGFWAVMRHSSRSSMTAFVLISEPGTRCSCPARQNTSCLALCSPIQHQLPVVYSVHACGSYQQ